MSIKSKKTKQNLILIIISIVIIVVTYFGYKIIALLKRPTNTTIVKNGELINYEEVVGYIVREEGIVDTSSYSGIAKPIISDLNRVAKQGTIVSYVSVAEESLAKKIAELDVKIQEAMNNQQTIFSGDVKTLESDIQIKLYDLMSIKNDVYMVHEYKNAINEKIEKKAKIVGELSPAGSKIKELIEERIEYEIQINNSKKELKANKAGLVSYRIDNLENVLTFDSIKSLTIKQLEDLEINTGQVIPIDINNIKIVNNFECYVVIPMSSEESKKAELNDKIYFRFDNSQNEFIPATVEYISEEDDKRLIIFKIKSNVEELVKYRKIALDVIWWRTEGIKIPNNSIKIEPVYDENGNIVTELPTILVQKLGYVENVWIKVVNKAGDFSIIENITEEELIEMGIPEKIIENRKTVKMYDEIIVN